MRQAGWRTSYRFDPELYRKDLEADGHELSGKVLLFLQRWGGLSVRLPRELGPNGTPLVDFFHTFADRASRAIYPIQLRNMEEAVGEKVCPVGETDCGHTTILIGASGATYLFWGPDGYKKILDWKNDDFESTIEYLAK